MREMAEVEVSSGQRAVTLLRRILVAENNSRRSLRIAEPEPFDHSVWSDAADEYNRTLDEAERFLAQPMNYVPEPNADDHKLMVRLVDAVTQLKQEVGRCYRELGRGGWSAYDYAEKFDRLLEDVDDE